MIASKNQMSGAFTCRMTIGDNNVLPHDGLTAPV
jgi:hypothetical protein